MKQIYKLLVPLIGKKQLAKYVILGIIGGGLSFLFVNSITRILEAFSKTDSERVSNENIFILALLILMFVWVRKVLAMSIMVLSQKSFWTIRKQILNFVLHVNYKQFKSERNKITTILVNDVNILTDASITLIDFMSALVLTLACFAYLFFLSPFLFLITFCVATVGVIIFQLSARKNVKAFEKARELENIFMKNFTSILDGFRDLYLDKRKGNYLFNYKIKEIAKEAMENNSKAFLGFINNQIIGQVLFYILISSILVYFSIILDIENSIVISYIFTLLFLLTSIETVMVLLPGLAKANIAAGNILRLTNSFNNEDINKDIVSKIATKVEFQSLTIKELEFSHINNSEKFSIGPITLIINKGDVVFIYGGNGSGKTTFIYTLIGLNLMSKGSFTINNTNIDEHNFEYYKSAFSVVFSDFYLFNEILTFDKIDVQKWDFYIELFELKDKVLLHGNTFSTIELSTGQKKRLALISCLLENKPLLVLDEWAADQDPNFRRKFYSKIIPILKNEGFTIIAITHDDKYYNYADRLYEMDYGKLQEMKITI